MTVANGGGILRGIMGVSGMPRRRFERANHTRSSWASILDVNGCVQVIGNEQIVIVILDPFPRFKRSFSGVESRKELQQDDWD